MPNSGNYMKAMLLRPQTWLMALVAVATLGMAAPQSAKADVVEYRMTNRTHHVVSLKFYSRSRRVVWPGSTRVWVLLPRRQYSFRLRCARATAPGHAAGRAEAIGAFIAAIEAASAAVSDAATATRASQSDTSDDVFAGGRRGAVRALTKA